jgi:hypothetical protein
MDLTSFFLGRREVERHIVKSVAGPTKIPPPDRIWVARERELEALEAGLSELAAGRGALFLLTGEAGLGKTRLADEFGRRASARGARVHWGRAFEAGGAPAYWPLFQALRSLAAATGAAPWDLPRPFAGPGLEAPERFQMFEAIAAYLRARAAEAAQVMVLDDLHAADPSSLLLLGFIVRELRTLPLLIVGTYREAEARLMPEIERLLAQLAREGCRLPLRPLEHDEVARFVAEATGDAPNRDRVEALHRRSEGNPLFLRELLQLRGGDALRSSGIREVVRARLAPMPPDVRQVLEAAAVLGREFMIEPLAATAGAPEHEVRALLEPPTNAAIVEPLEQPPRWRFTHLLLREGLYEALEPNRRGALHFAAARALGGRAPAMEVAHHLLRARPLVSVAEAADAAQRAGDEALRILAFEDARDLYARAAALLEGVSGEEPRRFEALLGLGAAHVLAAEVELGKKACQRAADLARRLSDGERFARAVLGGAGEFAPELRDASLIALLEEALRLLPAGDGPLRARVMARLAAERQPEPDTRPPADLARAAIAMARATGDAETLRAAIAAGGVALGVYADDPGERLALNQELLRLTLAAGDKRGALRAHLYLVGDHWEQGDRAGAEAHTRAFEALEREFRHGRFRWVTIMLGAAAALCQGRFADAERACAEGGALRLDDESRGAAMTANPPAFATIAERYDDLPRIEAALRAEMGAMPHGLLGCIAEMMIAQLHGRAGDRRRAELEQKAVLAHPLFAAITEPAWLALLAEPCHLLHDTALAERIYPRLVSRAKRFHLLGPISFAIGPPYARQLGLLAETLGRLDDAVAHLSAALALTEEAGMRGHQARLRYELAGPLLRRGGPGDREHAAALLEAARALALELGQAGLLERLAARAVEAGPSPRSTPRPAPAPASSRPVFRMEREGDYWTIASGGRTLRLKDSRGLAVLARLIEAPGQEFHVLQLASPESDGVAGAADLGPLLDAEAVQRYRQRLLELREHLEEAEAFGDRGRADRVSEEIEFLTLELARAVGLGGRTRATGAAERARTTVQKRLRSAIARIAAELPELGRHLDQTVRTGAFCGYLPEGRPPRARD